MSLTCPKCHGEMRTYERGGVHVDQCGECRGLFLDRGELEHLIDAEQRWHQAPPPAPYPPQQSGHGYDRDYGHHRKRRKKSFMDDLFDL